MIGPDSGFATGRYSLIVWVVVLMVYLAMVMVPTPTPMAMVMMVVILFKFELFLVHFILKVTKIIHQ